MIYSMTRKRKLHEFSRSYAALMNHLLPLFIDDMDSQRNYLYAMAWLHNPDWKLWKTNIAIITHTHTHQGEIKPFCLLWEIILVFVCVTVWNQTCFKANIKINIEDQGSLKNHELIFALLIPFMTNNSVYDEFSWGACFTAPHSQCPMKITTTNLKTLEVIYPPKALEGRKWKPLWNEASE